MSQFSSNLGIFFFFFFSADLGQDSGTAPSEGLCAAVLKPVVCSRGTSHTPQEAIPWDAGGVWAGGSEGLETQVGEAQNLLGLGEQRWRTSREKRWWKNLRLHG